ncbi:MAG TPA: Ger(x)C family spore germination protein [Ureibacillus sp.]|nr:Ger(x)C family spore germination protein [Ureibacillus sp.]
MLRKLKTLKKYQIILVVLLSLFFLSACSIKEIEKSAFIAEIGIDSSGNSEKPFKVTLKIYNPTSSIKESDSPNYIYISEDGKSITDAIRLLETKVDKRLEFGHLKFIILGEESIEKLQIRDMLDFFSRRPDIQLISWVMIGRPSAEHIVKMVPKSETAAYTSLFNYFDQNANESPFIVSRFLFDFRRKYFDEGVDPVLPIVETEEQEFKIDSALIIGENKNTVALDTNETRIYDILKGNVFKADLIVDTENEYFMIEADKIHVNYQTVEDSDGSITLKVHINAKGIIVESKKHLEIDNLKKYNELAGKHATELTKKFIIKLQESEIDPIGFGVRYQTTKLHNHLMSYEEWMKAYKDADLDIKVTFELKSTGQLG